MKVQELAVELATEVFTLAIPFALVFGLCELIISTFLRAAFGGRLWFGK